MAHAASNYQVRQDFNQNLLPPRLASPSFFSKHPVTVLPGGTRTLACSYRRASHWSRRATRAAVRAAAGGRAWPPAWRRCCPPCRAPKRRRRGASACARCRRGRSWTPKSAACRRPPSASRALRGSSPAQPASSAPFGIAKK
eukprot:3743960-Pleurochrysis_carterae.AAC.1